MGQDSLEQNYFPVLYLYLFSLREHLDKGDFLFRVAVQEEFSRNPTAFFNTM